MDAKEACRVVLDSVDIPFWPQLPHRSFKESMAPQYTEGFPFVKVQGESVVVVKPEESALNEFYEAIAEKRGFPISEEFSAGFYAFINMLQQRNSKLDVVKGHITGPLTFALSVTDEQKRPIYFNDELRDLSIELLKGKIRWQIEELSKYADKVLMFIDEPIMSALGTSTYLGVSTEDALNIIRDILEYINECGAISAIHCCGKADWSFALSAKPDVFNFDAFSFADTLGLYPQEITSFMNNGGYIAWGIVPTTDDIRDADYDGLKSRLESGFSTLQKAGVPDASIRKQVLLSPSCGTGSLEVKDALKAFSLLKKLRNSYVGG